MPSLGADMEAGTLIEWKVKPGDQVRSGDIIGEIETEKGDIDIEVFESGTVEHLFIKPGDKVPVGAVVATIREEGELPGDGAADSEPGPKKEWVRTSPLARRIAAEKHIDLSQVIGTGPGGAVLRADVEHVAAEQAGTAEVEHVAAEQAGTAEVEHVPVEQAGTADIEQVAAKAGALPSTERRPSAPRPDAMRRAIAAAMARSNREIPHYFLETKIDMSRCLSWLEAENGSRPVHNRLLPVVPMIKAVALALGDVPELNGYWIDDELRIQEAVHIGFTISLRTGGVVVPALHHADSRTPDELMADLSDLILRAREGRLRSSELTDATITITNLGDLGIETVFGIIFPPQVALVGFGRITEQAWAENGMLDVRPILTATLSGDHRATDGRTGARFLTSVADHLQDPASL